MLSGEGNQNGEKTTICLISKRETLQVQHTFLYNSLPLFCRKFLKVSRCSRGYTFYGGNVIRVLVHHFFSTVTHFHSGGASISYFLTAATKFHVVPPTKNVSFVFSISL